MAGDGPRHGPGLAQGCPGLCCCCVSPPPHPRRDCPAPLVALPGGPGSWCAGTLTRRQLPRTLSWPLVPLWGGDLTLGGGGTHRPLPAVAATLGAPLGVRRPPSPRARPPHTASRTRSPCADQQSRRSPCASPWPPSLLGRCPLRMSARADHDGSQESLEPPKSKPRGPSEPSSTDSRTSAIDAAQAFVSPAKFQGTH